ncbi:MAG: hypothetical protein KGI36_08210, partial [Burkholderiales bacterium]|nr:hypothetical protein [Burkholderiales bacterium]
GPAPVAGAGPLAYDHSVALGGWQAQPIGYSAGSATTPATVSTASASALLAAGSNALVAIHQEPALAGLIEVCVSGDGQSTNVVAPINLGVIAQSAAVLLDAGWSPLADPAAAWAALAARQAVLDGWENCGVKPEGAPSPSSRLTAQAGGGYAEDVYDGNPGTTYNVVSQTVTAAQMAAMLSATGYATSADPTRPLQLYWRFYADAAGHQLAIEMGLPQAGAPAALKGFIALYVPAP